MGIEKLKEAMSLIKECISEYGKDDEDEKDEGSPEEEASADEESDGDSSSDAGETSSGLSGKNRAVVMALKKRMYS